MSDEVKAASGGRRYHSPRRARQAAQTRRAVLAAARELVGEAGYGAMTVAKIARRAGVAVDTVYASVGRKPEVLRALVETALSGTDEEVPAAQRRYVQRIGEVPAARDKLEIYADAITGIQQRLAPVFLALRDAAVTDEDARALWREVSDRRARNMLVFAADLAATGELREDLTERRVADVLWSMNAAEYWTLLVVERGWTAEEYRHWVLDAWSRLLLR